ncbi:MAG: hypothetical protein NVS2B9_20780 [Myxococcales bacterium]
MKSGTAVLVVCALAVVGLFAGARACSPAGRQAEGTAAPSTPSGTSAGASATGKTGSASIAGIVRYRGPPLPPGRPAGLALPGCEGRTPQEPLQRSGDGVASAFVSVREGLPPGDYPVPAAPLTLDQRGCEFVPRVFGIRAGQPLELVNDDPTLHNVHALGESGGLAARGANAFNVAMPLQHGRVRRRFDAPQAMVTVVCDVHPWMRAYAGVVAHPFFAVSGAGGSYRIGGLPAGRYVVEAWQERLGRISAEVVVSEGESAALDLTFAR